MELPFYGMELLKPHHHSVFFFLKNNCRADRKPPSVASFLLERKHQGMAAFLTLKHRNETNIKIWQRLIPVLKHMATSRNTATLIGVDN